MFSSFVERLLGTPNEGNWPGVTSLPDYKSSFPSWSTKNLSANITGVTAQSSELIAVCLFSFFLLSW